MALPPCVTCKHSIKKQVVYHYAYICTDHKRDIGFHNIMISHYNTCDGYEYDEEKDSKGDDKE